MKMSHFVVAIIAWLCFVGFDNGYDFDWRYYKCFNCGDFAHAATWAGLAITWCGMGFAFIYGVIFSFRNIGKFLLFLVLTTLIIAGMFFEAERSGEAVFSDPRLMSLVASFVVFMAGATITGIDVGSRRRS